MAAITILLLSNFSILCSRFLNPTSLYLLISFPILKILPRQSRISNSRSSSRLIQVFHKKSHGEVFIYNNSYSNLKFGPFFWHKLFWNLQFAISWSPLLEWSLAEQWVLKTDLTPAQPTPLTFCFKFNFDIMNNSFNPYFTPCHINFKTH